MAATVKVHQSDIDRFIQEQKSKLATERQHFDDGDNRYTENEENLPKDKRKTWDKTAVINHPLAEEAPKRPKTTELSSLPLRNSVQENRKLLLAAQRNKEYNELIAKKKASQKQRTKPAVSAENISVEDYEKTQRILRYKKQQEYKRILDEQKAERDRLLLQQHSAEILQKTVAPPKQRPEDSHVVQPELRPDQNYQGRYDEKHSKQPTYDKSGRRPSIEELLDRLKHSQQETVAYMMDEHPVNYTQYSDTDGRFKRYTQEPADQTRQPLPDRERWKDYRHDETLPQANQYQSTSPRPLWQQDPEHDLKALNNIGHRDGDLRRRVDREAESEKAAYQEVWRQMHAGEAGIQPAPRGRENLPPKPPTPGGFLNKLGGNDKQRQRLNEERRQEYNKLIAEKSGRSGRNRQTDDYMATIPGLGGKERQHDKAKQRNDEYNQYMREKDAKPRPQSDKVLPNEVTDGPRRGWATPTYEEILNEKRAEEARYRRYDDPEYIRPGMRQYGSEGALHNLEDPQLRREAPRRSEPRAQNLPRSKDSDCYATLPIGQIGSTGHDKRHSAVQRQKEQYRQELEKQMKEMEELKKREKNEDLRINATGANDSAKRNNQLREVAQPPPQAPVVQVPVVVGQQYPAAEYMSRLANYDQISPRSELVLGRRRLNNDADLEKLRELDLPRLKYDMKRDWGTRVEADGGILERGFDTLLEPPKAISIQPPPELKYEPSPYLTGGTGYSSLDEQYHYLGTMNPLSADIAAPEVRAPQIALAQAGVVPMASGAVPSKIRFDDRGGGGGHYGGGGGGGYGGGGVGPLPLHSDEKDDKKVKQQQYQAELKRQMEEARQKKQSAKMEKEMYDRKFEEEYKNYNPFGKGGGGAPMRDQRGNVIADLRTVLKDGSGQSTGNLAGYESPRKWNPYTSPRPPSPRDDKIKTPPKQTTALGDVTHARGGHGIFGQPKTEAEKTEADRYKDDLQRQIEEKKMQKMLEKEKERMEEQIEERRIEEERRRMQIEVEEERRRIREKEEIARHQQEEHARQAEERRREIERKKKEEDEHHQEHLRQMEKERMERDALDRTSPHSRPQSNTHSYRAQSADVLNHLAQLKSQLQAERNRVETMLDQNEREIEVFDPRLAQRPPQVPVRQNMDVFEMARNRDAVSVKRTGTATEYASPSALHDFEKLKQNNTDSRHEFLRQYPHGPITSEALEAQQAALLREQERSLRMLKDRSTYDHAMPSMKARPGTDSAQSMLKSNSAFIDMDGLGPVFPEDLEDLPQRNDSARARRRRAVQQSPSLRHYDAFGSVSSLDVDQIAKRNEKRLKNLRDLQGDDVSMNDPDDLIDHFLKKQTHNRDYMLDFDSELESVAAY